jgi:hypothetical protein
VGLTQPKTPDAADADQGEDQQSVAEIAQPVAEQIAQRQQSPEGSIADAFGIGPIPGAQHRDGGKE